MAKRAAAPTFPDRITAISTLNRLWIDALNDPTAAANSDIIALVNSPQTSIRFCVLVQLLGKAADPSIDALCLQRGDGTGGKWEPRGFAAKIVVPWNRSNQSVLGPSNDPYVSNPLRRPRVDAGLDQMADRDQWDRLCAVLRDVEVCGDALHTEQVLRQALLAIRDRLRQLTFSYIVPNRVSFRQAEMLVTSFMAVKSGGDRGLAIVAALFETFREHLHIYKEVRRAVINAADTATEAVGDLECIGADGTIILAVEVKERQLSDADTHAALAKARRFGVRDLLFCTEAVRPADQEAVAKTFLNAWASGTSLYHVTVNELLRGALPLLGETGIHRFIVEVGSQLDQFSTQPLHRTAWKSLLDGL